MILSTYITAQQFLQRCAWYVSQVLHEIPWSLEHPQDLLVSTGHKLKTPHHGQTLHVKAVNLRPRDLVPSNLKTQKELINLHQIKINWQRLINQKSVGWIAESCLNLWASFSCPGCKESSGLVWSDSDDKLSLGVPAQVLHCIEVTRNDHTRPPFSLCNTQISIFIYPIY